MFSRSCFATFRPLMGIVVLFFLVMENARLLSAQESRFIEVTGFSELTKAPNLVKIRATLIGDGESADDATRFFKENRETFEDAINAMNFPDIEIEYQGAIIDIGNKDEMMEAADPIAEGGATNVSYRCLEEVIMMLPASEDTNEMLKEAATILDTCKTAKAKLNFSSMEMMYGMGELRPLMEVCHSDLKSLRKQVLAMAFEDAKTKAAELAELSGVKLGRVLQVSGLDGSMSGEEAWMEMMYSSETGEQPTLIRVKRQLVVRFEIE